MNQNAKVVIYVQCCCHFFVRIKRGGITQKSSKFAGIMVSFFEASLDTISVHHVGNPSINEFYALSDKPLELKDDVIPNLLMNYFLKPFEKTNEVYHLTHSSGDLNLNEVHHFATQIFEDKGKFHEASEQIAKHLYKVSNHPNIKPGELYVVYFKQVQIEGNPLDAIGIFKSENKAKVAAQKPIISMSCFLVKRCGILIGSFFIKPGWLYWATLLSKNLFRFSIIIVYWCHAEALEA